MNQLLKQVTFGTEVDQKHVHPLYIYGCPCIQDERKLAHKLSTVLQPARDFPFALYWYTQMGVRKSTTQIQRQCEVLELQPELLTYS